MRSVLSVSALAVTITACVTARPTGGSHEFGPVQSASAAPDSERIQDIEQLRGRQLATAIRGTTIVPRRRPIVPGRPIASPSSERFHADGTYVSYSDRVQAQGRYEILKDRYCVTMTVSANRRCLSLHRGRDGQHYLRQVFPVASDYWPVNLID